MSFQLSRRAAMRGAAAAAVAAAAAPTIALPGREARAALPGALGKITYRVGSDYWIANADGTSAKLLAADPTGGAGSGSWAPDGSRFFFGTADGPVSVRADGSGRFEFPWGSGEVGEPVVSADGRFLFYTAYGRLSYTATDGSWQTGDQVFSVPDDGLKDFAPAVSVDGTIVYVHGTYVDHGDIYRVDTSKKTTKIVTNGSAPDFSPDGAKLAFERLTLGAPSTRHLWICDAGGGNEVQLTTEALVGGSFWNRYPVWSPDGRYLLFTSQPASTGMPTLTRIDVETKQVTYLTEFVAKPTWQPVTGNFVERVWGQTALGTAIATSRYNWADRGVDDGIRPQAKVVVLSRDDMYQDALGGSALAVAKEGPLLITGKGSLDPATRAEIERVLGDTGTVYLLGGTLALSALIEQQVTQMGYTVKRLWGNSEYDTAVAIAVEITPNPVAVIVTTALKYYDALAAGAAAGANPGTVIVLTAGDTMPGATAAYLNTLDPDPYTGTMMIGVGGPGARALVGGYQHGQMPSWGSLEYWPVYGATEFETAVAVAEFFFSGPRTAAVATASTWFDALTGGAMVGSCLGPLLLSTPGTLSPQTEAYFNRTSASIKYAVLLGGPLALKSTLVTPLGAAISGPAQATYREYTETYRPALTAAKRSLTTADTRKRAVGGDVRAELPGARTQRPTRV
ncbi:cell wall-binding repeat-containing protein [Dactylosporangium aurantiacum]|uniref:Cell wall-binding repeat-containing protein n=1 Tax=Dactylosporangium aurantiacum TaxID=35754 RepID=A0A9Q9MF43_9ACTN|nr:cell wall-binding repeat-containing protein [Dactylosporangium aurantiacum]MDG6108884.1 cell wall-binding repeat-containing protein [Dactylosporangium aurantiacum]UWZ52180.1 cell wall-binding repeat-containing protein [Dactylosporangium aurantiacum]